MLTFPSALRIYLAVEAVDMRKQYDGLWSLAQDKLQENPRSGAVFVFVNKHRNRIKLLYWDGTGPWVFANTHAPHCALWFRCEDFLSVSPAIRKEDRSLRIGGRTAGVGLCSIAG